MNKELLLEMLEQIIEIENVEVELFDRAGNDTDELIAENLHKARITLEKIYRELKNG